MTVVMVLDYLGCYIIEKVLKSAFSDYRPKDIAVRRPEQLRIEEERKEGERREAERKRVEEVEKKREEAAAKLRSMGIGNGNGNVKRKT